MALVSATTARLKKNYHQTFEIRKGNKTVVRHTLLLNPQSMSQKEQSRSSVTQTLGGVYVTDFGSGLPAVTISGTTGYKERYNEDGELRDGYQEFKHFRNEVFRRFIETNDPSYEMYWYNWEDEEYFNIQPGTFDLQRSTSETLLYRYSFAFTCIAKASVNLAAKPSSIGEEIDFAQIGIRIAAGISDIGEIIARFNGYV